MTAGDTVLIDCPGHTLHGKACLVVRVENEFNLAPEGMPPYSAPLVLCKHPSLPSTIGFGPCHIAGTVEARQRRTWDAVDDDERQGSLLL